MLQHRMEAGAPKETAPTEGQSRQENEYTSATDHSRWHSAAPSADVRSPQHLAPVVAHLGAFRFGVDRAGRAIVVFWGGRKQFLVDEIHPAVLAAMRDYPARRRHPGRPAIQRPAVLLDDGMGAF
ncbi:MAG: hypothetical protein QM766_19150 [Burkholderiaceae bacterium]